MKQQGKRIRVAVVASGEAMNANYRALVPLGELERRGIVTFSIHDPNSMRFRASAIVESDVVLVHRFANDQLHRLVSGLRERGIGVVWDNDDDTLAIPRSNPLYRKRGGMNGHRIAQETAKMMRLADVVTTPSRALATRFALLGSSDVRILENYLPSAFADAKPRRIDGVELVWVAALEHQVDYERLRLRPVLEQLLERHADLQILSVGLGLGLRSTRYERISFTDFGTLVETIAGADIGIAPLTDIPWNQARSNVKLKEYGIAGLAWLASPVGAYAMLGEKQGGRLVRDDGWLDAIDRLVSNGRERKKLADKARKWARGETIDRHAGLWEAVLRDAIESAR